MSRFLPRLGAIVLLSACTESASGPSALVSVQGVAQDSLAAKPAPGVTVELGSSSATTDFLGAYQFANVAAGSYTITVSAPSFEAYTKPLTVSATTTHNIPLRRLAPFLKDFAITSNGSILLATVIDLQGAATFSAVNSGITYTVPGFTNFTTLRNALVDPIDATSVRVQFNIGRTGASLANWSLKDTEGHGAVFECSTGGCVER
jgi:hypothetical protein